MQSVTNGETQPIHSISLKMSSKQNPSASQGGIEGRGTWASRVEFFLSCVGFCVGLNNVWRFPYLCYKSGGGAFLIPYGIMLALIGFPMLFMEMAFGQYVGLGPITMWHFCPLFQGVGYGYVVLNSVISIYYFVIIAYGFHYLFASFHGELPWKSCGHPWNTPNCREEGISNLIALNQSLANISMDSYETSAVTKSTLLINETLVSNVYNTTTRVTTPAEEYWRRRVLKISDDVGSLGQIQWELVLYLLLAWILTFIFLCKGIKSSGKVVYFTAVFPYVMITVLVIRGLTLPGSLQGIIFYLRPDWSKLADAQVWYSAATQIFYSLGCSLGGFFCLSTYNKFDNNCYRDSIIVGFINCGTSVCAGFAVFSVLGFLANEYQLPVSEVVSSGPGLAFIAYPRALAAMPLAQLWSALFFFMIFLLGVDSQMVHLETVTTALTDEFPRLRRHRLLLTAALCALYFLVGIVFTTQAGMYLVQLFDWYCAAFGFICIAIVECVALNVIYGNTRLVHNIKSMLGFSPNWYWRVCWLVVTPLLLTFILVFSFVQYRPISLGDYVFPAWADRLGWFIAVLPVLPIPAVAILKMRNTEGATLKMRLSLLVKPEEIIDKRAKEHDALKTDKSKELQEFISNSTNRSDEEGHVYA